MSDYKINIWSARRIFIPMWPVSLDNQHISTYFCVLLSFNLSHNGILKPSRLQTAVSEIDVEMMTDACFNSVCVLKVKRGKNELKSWTQKNDSGLDLCDETRDAILQSQNTISDGPWDLFNISNI